MKTAQTKTPPEQQFRSAMKKILSVSKEEILRREADYKKRNEKRISGT
jgi:hypothetical protein